MINLSDFYFDNPDASHKEFPTGNMDEKVPPTDAAVHPSPPNAMDTNNAQSPKVSDTLGVHKKASQANAAGNPTDTIPPAADESAPMMVYLPNLLSLLPTPPVVMLKLLMPPPPRLLILPMLLMALYLLLLSLPKIRPMLPSLLLM